MDITVPAGTITFTAPKVVRMSYESARLDHNATVAPGTYPLFASIQCYPHEPRRVAAVWFEAPGICEGGGAAQAGEVRRVAERIETYWIGEASAKPAALDGLLPQFGIESWDTRQHDPKSATGIMSHLIIATGADFVVTAWGRGPYGTGAWIGSLDRAAQIKLAAEVIEECRKRPGDIEWDLRDRIGSTRKLLTDAQVRQRFDAALLLLPLTPARVVIKAGVAA